jgi:hypothetical protein
MYCATAKNKNQKMEQFAMFCTSRALAIPQYKSKRQTLVQHIAI